MKKVIVLFTYLIYTFGFINSVQSQSQTDSLNYGFLQVINNHVKDKNVWTAAYYKITGVYIKKSDIKDYDLTKNYCKGGLNTDEPLSIALESGLYDVKIIIRLTYYVGGNSEDIEKEALNVLIKEDYITKVFSEGGIEPPRIIKSKKDRRDDN